MLGAVEGKGRIESSFASTGYVDTSVYFTCLYVAGEAGETMPRSMVGLLAAVGVAMSALVGLAHGDLVWVAIADAAAASGLVAYVTAPSKKNSLRNGHHGHPRRIDGNVGIDASGQHGQIRARWRGCPESITLVVVAGHRRPSQTVTTEAARETRLAKSFAMRRHAKRTYDHTER